MRSLRDKEEWMNSVRKKKRDEIIISKRVKYDIEPTPMPPPQSTSIPSYRPFLYYDDTLTLVIV